MTINRHIKHNAKRALSGQWSTGIAAGIIVLCIHVLLVLLEYVIFALLSSDGYKQMFSEIEFIRLWIENGYYDAIMHLITLLIIFILTIFLVLPLLFGFVRWSFEVASARLAPITLLFYYFTGIKKYFKAIGISMSLLVRCIGYFILSLLPASFVYSIGVFYLNSSFYELYIYRVIQGFSLIALLLGLALGIYSVLKYMLVPYLHVENPDLSSSELISFSSSVMKHQRSSAIILLLSLLPLVVLSIFVVPIIFIIPYYNIIFAIYSKYMIERGKRDRTISI